MNAFDWALPNRQEQRQSRENEWTFNEYNGWMSNFYRKNVWFKRCDYNCKSIFGNRKQIKSDLLADELEYLIKNRRDTFKSGSPGVLRKLIRLAIFFCMPVCSFVCLFNSTFDWAAQKQSWANSLESVKKDDGDDAPNASSCQPI